MNMNDEQLKLTHTEPLAAGCVSYISSFVG